MWYKSKVLKGRKLGKELGFPTVNLDPSVWPDNYKQGVYACLVKYDGKLHKGALYFGPRLVLKEKYNVLEINIFDFNQKIYGKKIEFQIKKYVREPRDFTNLSALKSQLSKDIQQVKRL